MKRTAKMLTAALLALALALPGTAAAADDTPAVRISEMMYKNHATLQDADGDFSDWFELENTSNRVVRLKGWSVSDGKTVWDFPADAAILFLHHIDRRNGNFQHFGIFYFFVHKKISFFLSVSFCFNL